VNILFWSKYENEELGSRQIIFVSTSLLIKGKVYIKIFSISDIVYFEIDKS
jgi:hypothetical protein